MGKSVVNWFEIIATDFDRAVTFYEKLLGYAPKSMHRMEVAGGEMAMFPHEQGDSGIGGAIWKDDGQSKPSNQGTRIYLNVEGQMDAVIARVEGAGGKIVMPRTDISPHGFIALIHDSEGNIIGLHAMKG